GSPHRRPPVHDHRPGPGRRARGAALDEAGPLLRQGRQVVHLRRPRPEPGPRGEIIRGEKLSEETFTPDRFEAYAERLGIEYVILEQGPDPIPWAALWDSPPASLVLEEELLLRSRPYGPRYDGTMRVYRFTRPSPMPAPIEQVPVVGSA